MLYTFIKQQVIQLILKEKLFLLLNKIRYIVKERKKFLTF